MASDAFLAVSQKAQWAVENVPHKLITEPAVGLNRIKFNLSESQQLIVFTLQKLALLGNRKTHISNSGKLFH